MDITKYVTAIHQGCLFVSLCSVLGQSALLCFGTPSVYVLHSEWTPQFHVGTLWNITALRCYRFPIRSSGSSWRHGRTTSGNFKTSETCLLLRTSACTIQRLQFVLFVFRKWSGKGGWKRRLDWDEEASILGAHQYLLAGDGQRDLLL
jgi:hypothetical protein